MRYDDLIEDIDDLLGQDRYHWAAATLTGIRATVLASKTVTPGQAAAVANVRDARRSMDDGRPAAPASRRYEGFEPSPDRPWRYR